MLPYQKSDQPTELDTFVCQHLYFFMFARVLQGGDELSLVSTATNVGRLPFEIRIGVTGHRDLVNEPALLAQIDRALSRMEEIRSSPYTRPAFVVISLLAEGADRLVTREVMTKPHASLEVVLPMPRESYIADFVSAQSIRDFDELSSTAREVTTVRRFQTREEGYEEAGKRVVNRCDVLIALWDGETSRGKGGTAEVVEYARRRNKPIFWILTRGEVCTTEIGLEQLLSTAFRQTDAFNRAKVSQNLLQREVSARENALKTAAERVGATMPSVGAMCAWFLPFFARADLLAIRYQRRYYAFGTAVFLITAAAVGIVVIHGLLGRQLGPFIWIEIALILILLLLLRSGQQSRMHSEWVSQRFLAERFRAALFLALAGAPGQLAGDFSSNYLGRSSEEWLHRALVAVCGGRPATTAQEIDVPVLRSFLAEAWLDDQRVFYERAGQKSGARHLWLGRTIGVLFAPILVTLALTGANVIQSGVYNPLDWSNIVTIASTCLASLGAALTGIRAQREYHRTAQHFSQLEHYLGWLKDRILLVETLESIQKIATEVEEALLEENRDWFLVMRSHGFEL